MSLMAGFDLVAEISNETVRKLLEKNLQIGGVPVNPPFELNLPISGGGASGTAHLIVTDLQVDLNSDDTITLTLFFDHTSVLTTTPMSLCVCPLDGNITISAPLQLVSAGGSNKQVSVNLGAAVVAINWSSTANQEIASDLAGTGIPPALFNSFATQAITGYVQSISSPTIPLAFSVVPGTDGALTPSLQFERLEVHCISAASRNKQALGIFGILLKANDSHGDHHQKSATAITAAHDGVCISIAPGAFHSLVFCPAIASALGTDTAHLPGTCGPAGGFDTQGVTVNSISDSFAPGHIDINGSVSKSGFCYDAHGTFHGTLTFTVAGTTLTPDIAMDQPDVDVDIPWYCWLVAAVVLGPIGIALAAVADAVANNVANSLAGDAIKNALGSGIPGVSLGGLSGATFGSAPISPEGISLEGTVPVIVAHPSATSYMQLNGSVITVQSQEVGSGTFNARPWCLPEAKDYPYAEYSQQQRGSYVLTGTMVVQPLTPHFSIDAGGSAKSLTGNSGSVTLDNVNTHYPMPLATGGTAMNQSVQIGYSISGATVQLTNQPSDGDYAVHLTATATDCHGNPVKDGSNNNLTAAVDVQFEGDHVDIGGGYANDVQYCAQLLEKLLQRLSHQYMVHQQVPIWQEVDYPPPEELVQFIRDVMALGITQADEILVNSKIAHGNSFYRALFSRAASRPALLNSKAAGKLEQSQLANIAAEIAGLGQRIDLMIS